MKKKIEKLKICRFLCFREITELAEKLNELIDACNSEEEKPKERWKPEKGEEYYWINIDGEILHSCWNKIWGGEETYNFGNIFRTEKEAEEARDKIKELLNKL